MANYDDTSLLGALEDVRTQYIIPIYQRGYNWKTEQIKKLIDDLIDFSENTDDPNSKYYVGNIVTKTLPNQPGVLITRQVVVDGQQRITTTLLLVLALMKIDPEEFSDLSRLVKLKNKDETRLKIDRLNDGPILNKILNGAVLSAEEEQTNMYLNYKFAIKYIKTLSSPAVLYQGLQQTLLFNVILGLDENENKVFETINSSGIALSESDLIKNYIFFNSHSFDPETEKELVAKYVASIDKKIKPKDLNDFFRYFVAAKSENKKLVSMSKKNAIYNAFKNNLIDRNIDNNDSEDVRKLLNEVENFAEIWNIVNSDRLEVNMHNKFFLGVFRANLKTYFMLYSELMMKFNVDLNDEVTIQILKIISKLAIFRSIAGDPDKNITRDGSLVVEKFLNDVTEPTLEDFDQWIEEVEAAYRQPTLMIMKTASRTFNAYGNKNKLSNILKAYELAVIKNGTPADLNIKFTIEHIMPQNFTKWYPDIKENTPEYYQKAQELNTLGNLTLLTKPMNSSLSDGDFKRKVDGTKTSPGFSKDLLQMNQEISKKEEWNSLTIEKRGFKIVDDIYNFFNQ